MVEPARLRDALPTLALHRRVLGEGRWFLTHESEFATTVEERELQIKAPMASDEQIFLVARAQGHRVAGFLFVTTGPLRRMRGTGRVQLMVDHRLRSRGLGKALMSACVEWAEASPLHKLGLSVFADNDRAIKLYERFGFSIEARREREYVEDDGSFRDDLLMCRFL